MRAQFCNSSHLKPRTPQQPFCYFIIKANQGFTVIEALVATGILAAIIFVFLSTVQFVNSGMRNIINNNEIADTILRVNTAFGGDDRYCSQILGMKILRMSEPDGSAVDAIDYWDLRPTVPSRISNIVTRGSQVDQKASLVVTDIRIKPVAETGNIFSAGGIPSGKTLLANLEFSFSKTESLGPRETVRRIPVYAAVNSSDQIVICSTSPSSSILVLSELCSFSKYGYAIYDPFTKSCNDSPDVTWINGASSEIASCPAGMKVAVPSSAGLGRAVGTVCRVNSTVSVAVPPRTYSNGATWDAPVWGTSVSLNVPSSTCSFAYVTGTNHSLFTTQIKCVPQ